MTHGRWPQDPIGHDPRTREAAAPCYDGAVVGEGGVKKVGAGAPAEQEQQQQQEEFGAAAGGVWSSSSSRSLCSGSDGRRQRIDRPTRLCLPTHVAMLYLLDDGTRCASCCMHVRAKHVIQSVYTRSFPITHGHQPSLIFSRLDGCRWAFLSRARTHTLLSLRLRVLVSLVSIWLHTRVSECLCPCASARLCISVHLCV